MTRTPTDRPEAPRLLVTFDLFSALTDSATGAGAGFATLAAERGWRLTGADLYAAWDGHNKAAQRSARPPTTFAEVSAGALAAAYRDLGLDPGADSGRAAADMRRVHAGVGDWPLWPDVAAGRAAVAALPEVAATGLLSNVDDDLAAASRGGRLVDPRWRLTSQRLGAFKPDAAIYAAAATAAAEADPPLRLVHVAASGRDVRGSVEAGLDVVRLVRPGHRLDPDGPAPTHQVDDAADLAAAIADLARGV